MNLGLVARSDNTGLGIQTWEFYRHMQPAKTMVVDISALNNTKQHPERYPDGIFINGFPKTADIEGFLQGLDVVFIAESPYNYYLIQKARDMGIKTAIQYNYEFFDWFAYPHYPTPDLLIAPSKWGWDKVAEFAEARGIGHVYLHCPVNRDVLPFRKIERVRKFIHIVGREAAHDRNGTNSVKAAMELVKSPDVEMVYYNQTGFELPNYWDLYKEGDVLVLPRRYGGNCLQLNEALSVGMPVIMTDISPNYDFLPGQWLVPATKIAEFKPRMVVDIYAAKPEALAAKIDEFAGKNKGDMRFENIWADKLAQKISWKALQPEYERVLSELCR